MQDRVSGSVERVKIDISTDASGTERDWSIPSNTAGDVSMNLQLELRMAEAASVNWDHLIALSAIIDEQAEDIARTSDRCLEDTRYVAVIKNILKTDVSRSLAAGNGNGIYNACGLLYEVAKSWEQLTDNGLRSTRDVYREISRALGAIGLSRADPSRYLPRHVLDIYYAVEWQAFGRGDVPFPISAEELERRKEYVR